MYAFANAAPQARARLTALAEVFDPGTIRHLSGRGIAPGWTCLEIGGGVGSITRWLATRVGPNGAVVTTDIDTRHLTALGLPNVDVRRHDVVEDDLPEQEFDLVFTRLVLQHVSDPHRALTNMLRSVKPGGWMLVEDFEVLPGLVDSGAEGVEHISKTAAAMRQVTAAAGADARFGRSLPRRFRAAGLTGVGAEGRVFLWNGGSTGALFTRLNYEQLRESILATGRVTGDEYAADVARLSDEEFEVRSPIMWTTWGQRPPS